MLNYRTDNPGDAILMRSCFIYNEYMKPSRVSIAQEIFRSALQAVDPHKAVASHIEDIRARLEYRRPRRLIVVGFGKASCPMAKAVEEGLAGLVEAGLVITKYGHCSQNGPGVIGIREAGHPVPDENGVEATIEMTGLLRDADKDTCVICLISGGGSALLVSPVEGISLRDKQEITGMLLKTGADIGELNAVRKHISRVKGGRLAETAYPARVISLILSDVIGDRLDVIASGPTAPDESTYDDALQVLEKYSLLDVAPPAVTHFLRKGTGRLIPETPKRGSPLFEGVENIIIGSSRIALEAAKSNAESLGFHSEIISTGLTGEARAAAGWLAREALEARAGHKRICLISGGETTVTVKGDGLGGRNMELALAFALEIDGIDGIKLLSAGTDGTDGPTDAAGAVVDGGTAARARALGLDPAAYLDNNDSYNFFSKEGGLLVTGPTGTNVMDIQIVEIN